MRRACWLLVVLLAASVALGSQAVASDAERPPSAADVDAAVRRAAAFLKANQNDDGGWGHFDAGDAVTPAADGADPQPRRPINRPDPGGARTSLVLFALINAGESPQSPIVQKAVKFLRTTPAGQTYAVALRAAALAQLPEQMRPRDLQEAVRWLNLGVIPTGPLAGGYTYGSARQKGQVMTGSADLSNSQYGAMGMYLAQEDAGLEVSNAYWQRCETFWRRAQQSDGGWGYQASRGATSTLSMTAAGVATLGETFEELHTADAYSLSTTADPTDKPRDAGLAWLGDHFAPGAGTPYLHYTLFTLERLAEAGGLTRFGTHVWFDEGARFLLASQQPNGSWSNGSIGLCEDTAYGLLFLARGRSPVAVQKLAYDGRWNNRPRDVGRFTTWLRHQTERHLNWQVVPATASVAELREAPLLYVSGDKPLRLPDDAKQNIKQYLDQGGLLVCVNEGVREEFAGSCEALARELYPNYPMRDLSPEHPIFHSWLPLRQPMRYPVRAMGNGVRELIVLLPKADLSWQLHGRMLRSLNQAYPLFADLWAYAADRSNPTVKHEDAWADAAVDPAAPAPRRTIRIARLQYNGNWDPEPAGWQRLAACFRRSCDARLDVEPVTLGTRALTPARPFAHLTATDPPKFSPRELADLRQYTESGGTILFDAAGGADHVADAFESTLASVYPGSKFETLPPDAAVYQGHRFGGDDVDGVRYRPLTTRKLGDLNVPRLRGLFVHNRLVAVSSPEDLSAALALVHTDGINGYQPDSATALVTNLILYATAPRPPDTARAE